MRPIGLLLVLTLACGCALAQDLPYTMIPRLPAAPALDGTLADPLWQRAALLPGFVGLEGTSSPTQQTQVRLCHDGERLYLGVVCHEDRLDRVQATTATRDGTVWADDCLEVFINGTAPGTYTHLMVNPAGTVADERCSGESKDLAWNCDVQAKTGKTDGAWTVTFSVPLRQVELTPGQPSRLNVCRSEHPHRELSCWSPTLAGFHQPTRAGQVRLGTTPAALTGLQWGKPWPGDNSLAFATTAAEAVTPSLCVAVAGKAETVPLTQAGAGQFTYRFSATGTTRLTLEVKSGTMLLSRQSAVVEVKDYAPALAALGTRLAALSPAAQALPAAAGVRIDLAALQTRTQAPEQMTPQQWERLGEEVTALGRRVDGLRLRAAALAAGGQSIYATGVQSPLVKMLRDEPFTGQIEAPLALSAARNEYEAAQLVLFAFDQPLRQVRLEFSELVGRSGQHFASRNLSWRQVGYIPTEKPTYAVSFVGLWPDPLLPSAPFDVAAQSFESTWISAYVPSGTPPGDYQGTVTIRPENAPARTVPLRLHVLGFTLPRTNHLKTSFGCSVGGRLDRYKWWDNMLAHRVSPTGAPGATIGQPRLDLSAYPRLAFSARRVAGSPEASVRLQIGSEQSPQSLYGPLALGADWREFVIDLPAGRDAVRSLGLQLAAPADLTLEVKDLRAVGPGEALRVAPQASQWYGGAGSAVTAGPGGVLRFTFTREATGGWLQDWPAAYVSVWEAANKPATMDFSAFDEYVRRYGPRGLSACAVNVPSTSYQQDAARAVRRLRESGTAAVAAGWEQHLRQTGLLPMAYTYMADEPEAAFFPTLNGILSEVHRGAPGLANMMTARGAGAKGLHDVDIWCPEVYSFNPEGAAAEQARGREVWWYVAFSTRHPFPNYWVDYPALDCRVLWWMAWKHKLDGILYWSINYQWDKAWQTAALYPGANGDGSLVYPAADGGVVASIRWEAIRDGAEDYEYLWLLRECVVQASKRRIAPDLVAHARRLLAIDDRTVRSFKEYNPDPSRLLADRADMGTTIEALCRALGAQPADRPLQTSRRMPAPSAQPCVAPPQTVAQPVGADANPVPPAAGAAGACYRFEGSEPFITDDSGAANHGLVQGGERVAGRFGQGLKLSGDRSSVTLPGAATLLAPSCTSGTVALWVKPDYDPLCQAGDTWSGWTVFLYAQRTSGNGLPDGYNEIGLSAHGQTLFGKVNSTGDYGSYPSTPMPLRQGVWSHLALTWTGEERVLYVDGKPVARTTGHFAPTQLDGCPVVVGKHPPTGRWGFKGTVDDVLVSPRALTAAQVAALARGDVTGLAR